MDDHVKGLLITAGGVLAITPDALLIKMSGMSAPSLFFWRGMLVALMMSVPFIFIWRGEFIARCMAIGRPGIAVAFCYAISTACFVAANTMTVAANVLVIVATAPLFSSIFSSWMLKERTRPRTWLASLIALGGVALVGADEISREAGLGELLALGCSIFVSLSFVIIRKAKTVSMIPGTALGAFIMGLAGCFWFDVPAGETEWFAVLISGLFFIPLAYLGLTVGPRYISAPEVGLFLLLETVIGPIWVWLVIDETPSQIGLIGGAIILLALLSNTVLGLRERPA
ncbi:MAG: DMT family transporter [Minwuia sp.]|nr:DMT family transporter [Minwuia sp.]